MKQQDITIIAAMSKNNVIGKDGKLPSWKAPGDLKRFKELTSNHYIIMGRKTYEDTPVLKNRTNIIITRDKDYTPKKSEHIVAHSIDEALDHCKNEQEVFVIGGGEIYKQTLPYATKMQITNVNDTVKGDNLTFFPKVNYDNWSLEQTEKHNPTHVFKTYVKK